jgi:hypothetical protein
MTVEQCLEVRERLTEYAVSTLPEDELREVERHLDWCAACRKEARELREGAAMAGMSLPPSELPSSLEDRVVQRVRSAARVRPAGTRRTAVRRTLTILAAVVGLVGMGTAGVLFAQRQTAEDRLLRSEQQARQIAERLESFISGLPRESRQPRALAQATLRSPSGGLGGGGALRISSPTREDIALVTVGGLASSAAPYKVWLKGVSGASLFVGNISQLDTSGAGSTTREYPDDLRLYRYVEVRDASNRLVLRGAFTASS